MSIRYGLLISYYCCLHKTCQNTNKHKIGTCLRAKIVRAISRKPITQSSRSFCNRLTYIHPSAWCPQFFYFLHISISFLQTRHQNPPFHYCAVNISRTHSSIVPISFAIDSPIFAAWPGALSLSNFFIYPFLQAWHQNPPLTTVQSISRKPITRSS